MDSMTFLERMARKWEEKIEASLAHDGRGEKSRCKWG